MRLDPNKILPSQNFLKPHTIQFIFKCIKEGKFDELPPAPIVRQDEAGNYLAIDGHNLIAVRAFLKEEIEVHVASNASDGLPETSEENIARNKELAAKYETVILDHAQVVRQGIQTFHDLIEHYQDLFIEK